jgi:hypothetical protein
MPTFIGKELESYPKDYPEAFRGAATQCDSIRGTRCVTLVDPTPYGASYLQLVALRVSAGMVRNAGINPAAKKPPGARRGRLERETFAEA